MDANEQNNSQPAQITPEQAALVLQADFKNIIQKVKDEKTLTASERKLLQSFQHGTAQEYADNAHELSEILGVNRKTISRWRKIDGNPGTQADGRYHVASWRQFKIEHGRDGAEDDSDNPRQRKLRLENDKLEIQIAILSKQYVSALDVEKEVGDMINVAKSTLLSGPRSLAPQVVGVSIPEAEKILTEWLFRALSALQKNPLGKMEAPNA
jgi:hypothetical protein